MPTRSRTSFQKRQKEIARMEKQREKAARRAERKRTAAESPNEPEWTGEETTGPAGTAPAPEP